MDTITDKCVTVCNSLLRGELSAVETYRQAVEKFAGKPQLETLARIQSEHRDSAAMIEQHLQVMGAEPSPGSGAWGAFARAAEGTAKVFGEEAAVAVLAEGEEHGLREYEDALADVEVMDDIKIVIRDILVPRLQQHLEALKVVRESID